MKRGTAGRRSGRRSAGRLAAKAALSLAVLGAALCLAELLHRVDRYGRAGLSMRAMKSVHALGDSGLLRAAAAPGLRYELAPGVDTRFKLARFRTNSAGMRDREYSVAKAPGVFRVAVIGDSFTMGSGVAIEDVYHSRLERRLNADLDAPEFEFLNFGVGGYGLRDYVAVLAQKALRYDPDLILLGITRNDQTPIGPHPRPFRPRPVVDHSRRFTLFDTLSHELSVRRKRRALAARRTTAPAGSDSATAHGRNLNQLRTAYVDETFAELRALAEEARVPVLVVHLFAGFTPEGHPSIRRFEQTARENGFHFLDVSPGFEGLDASSFHIFEHDHHPDARGHAIFAERILDFLRRSELIPS